MASASRGAAASRWSAPSARHERFRIVCHGGAWDIPSALVVPHRAGVGAAYETAARALRGGADPLDAVVLALSVMEDDPTFDAGYGSFLNAEGRVVSLQELDAAVMEGSEMKAGAVASVSCFAQPSRAALAVLRNSPHVLMVGRGAEEFCSSPLGGGLPRCDPGSLVLPRERQNHLDWLAAGRPDARAFFKEKEWVGEDGPRRGTVGVVLAVRDESTHDEGEEEDGIARWRLFAGTSTGGTPGKLVGRVGDVPIVGGGLYADDEGAAVSCSGWGEGLMRVCAARDVSALCQQGVHPQQAVEQTLQRLHRRVGGHGGIIAVDKRGRLGAAFSTPDFAVAADESLHCARLALL